MTASCRLVVRTRPCAWSRRPAAAPAAAAAGRSTALFLPKRVGNVRALQEYARARQQRDSRLERLGCCGPLSRELLSIVASCAQLQWLRMLSFHWSTVDLWSGPALDLSSLMTATGEPRLPPLTQLRLPTNRVLGNAGDCCAPEREQAFAAASQQLVAAYSAQLTSLCVAVSSAPSLRSWLCLLLTRCRHLADLSIDVLDCGDLHAGPPLALQWEPEPAGDVLLPGLKRLRLERLPLSEGGLLALLRCCPELEVCSLQDLPHVKQAGERALRCCPKLQSAAEWLPECW